jgi:fluoroacetyl-CoA thioesterase
MCALPALEPGLSGEASVTVTDDLTAAALGSGNVDVYSTPAMIALLEAAAINALAGHLADGHTSVGISLDVRHLAATPVGMNVILSQGIRLRELNAVVGGDSLQLHLSPSC